jgi:transketolase
VQTSINIPALMNVATRLRIDSVLSTSEAGSGHPSTCCSAAEIVAALFFAEMRYDAADPQNPDNDRFVLSKGHGAPILYAAWAEAGFLKREDLLTLRRLDSDLEGHPTPRLPFVDVATGSLGQGLCAGVGIALNARRIGSDYRTYVLLGDGESAEGSVWEAADVAAYHKIDSLCGITDMNALGQSGPTQLQHDIEALAGRCFFSDCQHQDEPRCVVREALAAGTIDAERFQSYEKLQKELKYQARRRDKLSEIEERKKWKKLSRLASERARLKRR